MSKLLIILPTISLLVQLAHGKPRLPEKETTGILSKPNSDGAEDAENVKNYSTYPKYKYSYDVGDFKTGDYKNHTEERDGDTVRGEYTIAESNGVLRTVQYRADDKHGYQSVILTSNDGNPEDSDSSSSDGRNPKVDLDVNPEGLDHHQNSASSDGQNQNVDINGNPEDFDHHQNSASNDGRNPEEDPDQVGDESLHIPADSSGDQGSGILEHGINRIVVSDPKMLEGRYTRVRSKFQHRNPNRVFRKRKPANLNVIRFQPGKPAHIIVSGVQHGKINVAINRESQQADYNVHESGQQKQEDFDDNVSEQRVPNNFSVRIPQHKRPMDFVVSESQQKTGARYHQEGKSEDVSATDFDAHGSRQRETGDFIVNEIQPGGSRDEVIRQPQQGIIHEFEHRQPQQGIIEFKHQRQKDFNSDEVIHQPQQEFEYRRTKDFSLNGSQLEDQTDFHARIPKHRRPNIVVPQQEFEHGGPKDFSLDGSQQNQTDFQARGSQHRRPNAVVYKLEQDKLSEAITHNVAYESQQEKADFERTHANVVINRRPVVGIVDEPQEERRVIYKSNHQNPTNFKVHASPQDFVVRVPQHRRPIYFEDNDSQQKYHVHEYRRGKSVNLNADGSEPADFDRTIPVAKIEELDEDKISEPKNGVMQVKQFQNQKSLEDSIPYRQGKSVSFHVDESEQADFDRKIPVTNNEELVEDENSGRKDGVMQVKQFQNSESIVIPTAKPMANFKRSNQTNTRRVKLIKRRKPINRNRWYRLQAALKKQQNLGNQNKDSSTGTIVENYDYKTYHTHPQIHQQGKTNHYNIDVVVNNVSLVEDLSNAQKPKSYIHVYKEESDSDQIVNFEPHAHQFGTNEDKQLESGDSEEKVKTFRRLRNKSINHKNVNQGISDESNLLNHGSNSQVYQINQENAAVNHGSKSYVLVNNAHPNHPLEDVTQDFVSSAKTFPKHNKLEKFELGGKKNIGVVNQGSKSYIDVNHAQTYDHLVEDVTQDFESSAKTFPEYNKLEKFESRGEKNNAVVHQGSKNYVNVNNAHLHEHPVEDVVSSVKTFPVHTKQENFESKGQKYNSGVNHGSKSYININLAQISGHPLKVQHVGNVDDVNLETPQNQYESQDTTIFSGHNKEYTQEGSRSKTYKIPKEGVISNDDQVVHVDSVKYANSGRILRSRNQNKNKINGQVLNHRGSIKFRQTLNSINYSDQDFSVENKAVQRHLYSDEQLQKPEQVIKIKQNGWAKPSTYTEQEIMTQQNGRAKHSSHLEQGSVGKNSVDRIKTLNHEWIQENPGITSEGNFKHLVTLPVPDDQTRGNNFEYEIITDHGDGAQNYYSPTQDARNHLPSVASASVKNEPKHLQKQELNHFISNQKELEIPKVSTSNYNSKQVVQAKENYYNEREEYNYAPLTEDSVSNEQNKWNKQQLSPSINIDEENKNLKDSIVPVPHSYAEINLEHHPDKSKSSFNHQAINIPVEGNVVYTPQNYYNEQQPTPQTAAVTSSGPNYLNIQQFSIENIKHGFNQKDSVIPSTHSYKEIHAKIPQVESNRLEVKGDVQPSEPSIRDENSNTPFAAALISNGTRRKIRYKKRRFNPKSSKNQTNQRDSSEAASQNYEINFQHPQPESGQNFKGLEFNPIEGVLFKHTEQLRDEHNSPLSTAALISKEREHNYSAELNHLNLQFSKQGLQDSKTRVAHSYVEFNLQNAPVVSESTEQKFGQGAKENSVTGAEISKPNLQRPEDIHSQHFPVPLEHTEQQFRYNPQGKVDIKEAITSPSQQFRYTPQGTVGIKEMITSPPQSNRKPTQELFRPFVVAVEEVSAEDNKSNTNSNAFFQDMNLPVEAQAYILNAPVRPAIVEESKTNIQPDESKALPLVGNYEHYISHKDGKNVQTVGEVSDYNQHNYKYPDTIKESQTQTQTSAVGIVKNQTPIRTHGEFQKSSPSLTPGQIPDVEISISHHSPAHYVRKTQELKPLNGDIEFGSPNSLHAQASRNSADDQHAPVHHVRKTQELKPPAGDIGFGSQNPLHVQADDQNSHFGYNLETRVSKSNANYQGAAAVEQKLGDLSLYSYVAGDVSQPTFGGDQQNYAQNPSSLEWYKQALDNAEASETPQGFNHQIKQTHPEDVEKQQQLYHLTTQRGKSNEQIGGSHEQQALFHLTLQQNKHHQRSQGQLSVNQQHILNYDQRSQVQPAVNQQHNLNSQIPQSYHTATQGKKYTHVSLNHFNAEQNSTQQKHLEQNLNLHSTQNNGYDSKNSQGFEEVNTNENLEASTIDSKDKQLPKSYVQINTQQLPSYAFKVSHNSNSNLESKFQGTSAQDHASKTIQRFNQQNPTKATETPQNPNHENADNSVNRQEHLHDLQALNHNAALQVHAQALSNNFKAKQDQNESTFKSGNAPKSYVQINTQQSPSYTLNVSHQSKAISDSKRQGATAESNAFDVHKQYPEVSNQQEKFGNQLNHRDELLVFRNNQKHVQLEQGIIHPLSYQITQDSKQENVVKSYENTNPKQIPSFTFRSDSGKTPSNQDNFQISQRLNSNSNTPTPTIVVNNNSQTNNYGKVQKNNEQNFQNFQHQNLQTNTQNEKGVVQVVQNNNKQHRYYQQRPTSVGEVLQLQNHQIQSQNEKQVTQDEQSYHYEQTDARKGVVQVVQNSNKHQYYLQPQTTIGEVLQVQNNQLQPQTKSEKQVTKDAQSYHYQQLDAEKGVNQVVQSNNKQHQYYLHPQSNVGEVLHVQNQQLQPQTNNQKQVAQEVQSYHYYQPDTEDKKEKVQLVHSYYSNNKTELKANNKVHSYHQTQPETNKNIVKINSEKIQNLQQSPENIGLKKLQKPKSYVQLIIEQTPSTLVQLPRVLKTSKPLKQALEVTPITNQQGQNSQAKQDPEFQPRDQTQNHYHGSSVQQLEVPKEVANFQPSQYVQTVSLNQPQEISYNGGAMSMSKGFNPSQYYPFQPVQEFVQMQPVLNEGERMAISEYNPGAQSGFAPVKIRSYHHHPSQH